MNKKEKIYEALTNVKREYVEEAERFNFKKRRISFSRILGMAAAACLVVAMAAIAIIPKRERNPWAANAPTNAPTETGAPDYESLAFVGREKLCDITMVEHISVPSHSQLEGSRAEALGYLGDPAGAVGPVGLTAASDERFILLDQVCKRLFTINRDGNFSTYFLSFCDRPRAIAYLDGADPSLGDPVVSPEDAIVVNDEGSQYAILDDSLRSFVGEGLIAVLDSENIRVLRLPDMELICTVSLSEQYYVYDFNYGHDQLRFADGKLYFEASSEKAYTVGVAALFENEHIGAEMLEEAPAMPQVSDVTDYTALNIEVPDGMTVSYGWFRKHRVDGWGRSWTVESDLITPIDAHDDLLLARTAYESNFENMKLFVGLYSSETDASCTMELDSENRLMAAQFAMSPSGRVYMMEFYEDRAELYELEYEANEAAEPTFDPMQEGPRTDWSGIENLNFCFESREELAAFISSLDMQDAEFNGFIEKYNDYFVNTKADVRAVLSKAEGIVFPQPEGRIFNLMGIGLSSELEGTLSLRYDLSKGKELRIDIYSEPNSRLEDMGGDVFAVELDPSSPIRELRGVSRKTALGDGRWQEEQHFSGRLGERFIRIEAMNCTRSEAESLIRSFGYETLEGLAFPANTDSELPYYPIYLTGLDELKEFASAAAMSDAEFERYLERNAQNMFGIRSPIDAARALEYLDSLPFPISAEQALGSIVFTPADGEYIIRYDTCSFRSCAEYGENGLFATFDEIAAALDVSIIDTGSHTHIGKLCKLNRDVPEELDLPTYYAEIDGKLVEITAFSRPAEKAVEEILSFDFGSASELVPQLLEPGAENLLYFTDLEALKAFLDSPELSDEEFDQFVSEKLDPAMGIVTKEDAREAARRMALIPFPMTAAFEPSGFEFYFYNKSWENYPYSIAYNMPDGGICSFFGQLEGEYSLAKDIEAYASSASPVDFEGNAFVNRLYYENFGDVHAFYADIGGRIVNAQFRNFTYDEALKTLLSFGFESIIESVIKSDPWYLEKAWEYAEFVNREYGFNFVKDEAKFNEADMSITFTHIESEEYINPQDIWIYFDKTEKAVKHVYIFGDGSDRPEEYASMNDEELRAVFDQLDLFATYSVTREDMLQAGYTLDGTDEDYVKIAEYCGKLKAAELENAHELHFYRCIEAEVGNARRNTEASVKNSTDPVYCWVTYYFRPAYPKLFTHNTADIGCNMNLIDDADHPGWIYFGGDVLITPTAEGWSCQLAYISGY